MAITITATPAAYSSVNDNLIFTVSSTKTSDPVTYPNYKFIGDIYIGGVIVARVRKIQDPLTGIGIFNIGQVVRNYLATTFNPAGATLVAQQLGDGAFSVTVTMHFGEEYAYTSYYDLTIDSARTFFNNYNGRLVGPLTSLAAFTDKIASNRPITGQTLSSNNYELVPYFPTSTAAVSVTATPTGGGSGFTMTFTPAALAMQVLNLSPVALNALFAGTITPLTTSYTVQVGSQTYKFKIICEGQYQTYMVHFMNRYGGFESKLFSKVSRRTIDVTKKDFGKVNYLVAGDGSVSYHNANGVYYESRAVYSSQYIEKLLLSSDLLTDAEYVWLEDIVISPMVYLQDGAYFFPCKITDSTYEPKKFINDDLTNLVINIEFGVTLNAQSR